MTLSPSTILPRNMWHVPAISMTTVWRVVPVVLVCIVVWTNTEFPVDFWMHANMGRAMWNEHHFVTTDGFAHTIAGRPIVNQAWLAQLAMYGMVRSGGYAFAQFCAGVIYGLSMVLLGTVILRRCGNRRLAAALSLLALTGMVGNLAVRPQMFSVLLWTTMLWLLWSFQPGRATAIAAGVVELIWVNTHGAFPLGVVMPGIFLVGTIADQCRSNGSASLWHNARVRGYFAMTLAACCGALISPHGLRIIGYVSGVTAAASARGIEEWLPPSMHTLTGIGFYGSVALVLLVTSRSRRALSIRDTTILIAMLLLAARSQRMVLWWSMAVAPAIAPAVARLIRQLNRIGHVPIVRASSNTVVLVALGLFLVATTPWTRSYNWLLPASKRATAATGAPDGAIQYLHRARYRGNLYQPMEWGSFVTWNLGPDAQVFVDSRIDFFPDDVWRDYLLVSTRPSAAMRLLDKYAVDTVLWDRRRDGALISLLERAPNWHRSYGDNIAVIYQRGADRPSQSPEKVFLAESLAVRRMQFSR